MLHFLLNLIQCDASQMEGLVELQDNIMFYLVLILFGVGWILTSVIVNYASSKSPISHKYLNHGTLKKWILIITIVITVTRIYVWVFCPTFTIYCAPADDYGIVKAATLEGPRVIYGNLPYESPISSGIVWIGAAALWLIWGWSPFSATTDADTVVESVRVTNNNLVEIMTRLGEQMGVNRYGFEVGVSITGEGFYLTLVRSFRDGWATVQETTFTSFNSSMGLLFDGPVWELITSGDLHLEYTLTLGLVFQISNFGVVNILYQVERAPLEIRRLLGRMLNRFVELVDSGNLTIQYILQPGFWSTGGGGVVGMVPTMTEEPDLEMGVGYRYAWAWEGLPVPELLDPASGFIEIFEDDISDFYDEQSEERPDFFDIGY